jgi:hypothetical protein
VKQIVTVLFLILGFLKVNAEPCDVGKEFVVTLNYLKDSKVLKLSGADSIEVAKKVARGCEGAGKRFVVVGSLLSKLNLGQQKAVSVGLSAAQKTKSHQKVFMEIFRSAYLPNKMNLPAQRAVQVAQRAFEATDEQANYLADRIEGLIKLCGDKEFSSMPPSMCLETMVEVGLSASTENSNISRQVSEFWSSFDGSKDDPEQIIGFESKLKVLKRIVASGPYSIEGFNRVYQYATDKKNLNLAPQEAMKLALSIIEDEASK